jgi:hypothetical protein
MGVAGGIVVAVVLAVGMMTLIELVGRGMIAMMENDND